MIADVETTIKNKGNPFTEGNKLCYIGLRPVGQTSIIFNLLEKHTPLEEVQAILDSFDGIIAFNAKFDLHWLVQFGLDISKHRIWDCQYVEFLFSNQRWKYPDLDTSCRNRGLTPKIDVIAEKYWNNGIDTIDIPWEEMVQYLDQDLKSEEELFLAQQELFKTTNKHQYRLFLLHMEDLKCLREMEQNGILYDTEESLRKAEQIASRISEIEQRLRVGYADIPINFDSGDHLSSYLYGGSIAVDTRIPVGVFKTGAKIGLPRYKIVTHEFKLPKLFEPIKGSELKKEGYYSTDEQTLRQLRGTKEAKERLSLLDERAKSEKLRGTYYEGFPKKIREMAWGNNYLHPSFNQCSVVTGRLSSTNPKQITLGL